MDARLSSGRQSEGSTRLTRHTAQCTECAACLLNRVELGATPRGGGFLDDELSETQGCLENSTCSLRAWGARPPSSAISNGACSSNRRVPDCESEDRECNAPQAPHFHATECKETRDRSFKADLAGASPTSGAISYPVHLGVRISGSQPDHAGAIPARGVFAALA